MSNERTDTMKSNKSLRLFLFCSGWKTRPITGAVAFITFTLGLSLSALCVQLWIDLNNYVEQQSPAGHDYILISKDIGPIMLVRPDAALFSEQEQEELQNAPFVRQVDAVISNSFRSELFFKLGEFNYGTQLFFEAVPDSFLGTTKGWKWDVPESNAEPLPSVPILLPREFLSLYNLGFAPARNLPLLQEEMLGLIPLRLRAEGTAGRIELDARVVGTTDKIASILVPLSFMQWANDHYSAESKKIANRAGTEVHRLIVTVDNTDNPAIETFLRSHGYKSDSGSSGLRSAALLVGSVVAALAAVGGLIVLLCLLVLFLKLRVFLHESSADLKLLVLLGYRRNLLAVLSSLGIAIPGLVSALIGLCLCIFASNSLHSFLASRLFEFESELRPLVLVLLSLMTIFPCLLQFFIVRNELAISPTIRENTI